MVNKDEETLRQLTNDIKQTKNNTQKQELIQKRNILLKKLKIN